MQYCIFNPVKQQSENRGFKLRIPPWLLDGNTRVRLLFIGLSLILWFLIKLSKNGYVSTIDFAIDYSDLPKGMVFTEKPPKSLKIKVQGSGYNLIKYAWFNYRDLDVDLQNLESNRKGQNYWTSGSSRNYLEAQLSDETTRILEIHPDTVFFKISQLLTKAVPIKVRYNALFDTNAYILYGAPKLSQDSVWVEAPANVLNRLDYVETEQVNISEAQDSLAFDLKLIAPDYPHLHLSKELVAVQLYFSALTEGKVQIPITAIHLPDTVQMELFPSQVELTFRCALRDYKDIRPEEFEVYADFEEIAKNPETRFLSLSAENPPSQIRALQLQPKRVEYLISKP